MESMTYFITALLLAAGLQSGGKLSLLPRRFSIPITLLAGGLPWMLQEQLARTNLGELNRALSGAATLREYCALVVIQELLVMVAGFSLLADFESERRPKWWKFLVFVPSLLVPAGVLYLQLACFNLLVRWEFKTITAVLSAAVPMAALLLEEALRFFRRDRTSRALALFHFEWILLLLAIFLPVAASAGGLAGLDSFDWGAVPAWGVLAAPVAVGAACHWIYNRFLRKTTQRSLNQ